MGRIFVSYSRRDTEIIDRIVVSMCGAGLDVWLDRHNIRAGNQWRVQIVQAIDTCDAFVLMLSPNSAASDNVRKEIDLAQDAGRTIFVLMLEPVKLPVEIRYQLAGLQFIDVQRSGLDQAISLLNDTIKEHLAALQPMEEPKNQQVELVIQGIDLKAFGEEKQEQLLNFVAQLTNASRSGVMIAGMAAGSVHVFVDMPAGSAYQLKTLALNRDKRFKRFGITSLRLAGDKKFVNIALGILTAVATIGFLQFLWLGMPSLFLPVLGATAGKVVTISLAVVVTTGLAISAPKAIAPLLLPSPILTQTSTPTPVSTLSTLSLSQPLSQRYEASTAEKPPTKASNLTIIASETPALTVTASPTATPQDPLVLVDTACFKEPMVNDRVVSSLVMGTRVKLIARADTGDWWLVENPIYHSPCWVQFGVLQIDPGINVNDVPIFYIFSQPTSMPNPCTADTTAAENKACYCKWHSWDYITCD